MRLQVGQVALAQFQNRSLDTAAQLIVTPDTDGFLSQISTVQKVSENQNSILQDYQQAQANLAALEHSSETDLATLAEKEKQLKSLKDASDKKIAEARKVLNKLSATQRQRLSAEQKRAAARANAAGAAASRDAARGPISGSSKGVRALAFAKAQLGEPYVRNADGPSSWDCSGLTMAAWGSVGVSLPHSSGQQYNRGQAGSQGRSATRRSGLLLQPASAMWASTPAAAASSTRHIPASRWSTSRSPTCRTKEHVDPADRRSCRCGGVAISRRSKPSPHTLPSVSATRSRIDRATVGCDGSDAGAVRLLRLSCRARFYAASYGICGAR